MNASIALELEPFFREAGTGPGVVCLHSNASTSAQWRELMDRLAPKFRVLAPDSYGSGKSPDWTSDRIIHPRDEVALIDIALDAGDPDVAAESFIDYWMGCCAWKRGPEQRKPHIAASVVNVRRWAHALFSEPTPLEAFRALDIPVLYIVGKRSPASARGVARLLTAVLPRVEMLELEDLGHMGPMTHPDLVNDAIAQFLVQN
jgi:pimeloyl-ACP methyl ester carboxylesterase